MADTLDYFAAEAAADTLDCFAAAAAAAAADTLDCSAVPVLLVAPNSFDDISHVPCVYVDDVSTTHLFLKMLMDI